MSASRRFDTVIVGGGISGLVSGVRLAEQGLRVAVLEQGEQENYPCNTRYSAGGIFHLCFHGVNEDANVLVEAINEVTQGYADPVLARAVAADARTAVQWLKSKGIEFGKGGPDAFRENTLVPPLVLKRGLHWEGRGGDVLMRRLTAALKEYGGQLLLGTRARRLRMNDGACVGVEAEQGGQSLVFQANDVVLCDGGFQSNHDLLREFITHAPEKLQQRGAGVGKGDALRMARAAGARLVGMDKFYGHVLCQDALRNDQLWPFPMLDFLAMMGVVINGTGKRFMDEGLGGVYMANCVARLADSLSATVIYDETIWIGPHRDYLIPANPNIVEAGAEVFRSADLGGLAKQLGLPHGALEATVAQYNLSVDDGHTERLTPPRTAKKHKPCPIRQSPFYAVRLCASITSTMGGVAIDGMARVVSEQNTPISGLYAVGPTAGGLEGGPHAGYVGQLAQCSAMALRAANYIASVRRR